MCLILVVLGGLIVIVLAIGPKVRGLKPGQVDRFSRAIKIRGAPSFGGEVQPSAICRKILLHLKEPFEV
jgi:hypothetical protein